MPLRIDQVSHKVTINDVDVTPFVEKSTTKFGFDLASSECELVMTFLDPHFQYWDPVTVWAGTHSDVGDTASDIAGEPDGIKRFDGYLTDIDSSLWPQTVTVKCNGPLILAQRLICPSDDEADYEALSPDVKNALIPQYKNMAAGIDLSSEPMEYEFSGAPISPWGDHDPDFPVGPHGMVNWLLKNAGLLKQDDPLHNRVKFIGGVSSSDRPLGQIAFNQFVWKRGTSALSFIQDLDKICLGFRTFETLPDPHDAACIVRTQASLYAPFQETAYTLIEGTDFLDGTLNRNVKDARNLVTVMGFDDGGGAVKFTATGDCPILPPGIGIAADESPPSSPMIEVERAGDGGLDGGLSCQEVATWRLSELRFPLLTCSFSTWRDDPYSPAQVAYLNSPQMDNINQSTWIKAVTIEVLAGQFTQRLTCVSTAWRDRGGAPSLSLSLPAPLTVSP